MGIDAEIRFKLKDRHIIPDLSHIAREGVEIKLYYDEEIGTTHEVYQLMRYYGEHYERGPWPILLSILLYLMDEDDIDEVWYGGDNGCLEQMSHEKILEITQYWLHHGNRPYRNFFNKG